MELWTITELYLGEKSKQDNSKLRWVRDETEGGQQRPRSDLST